MKGHVVNTLGFAGQFLANSVTAAQKQPWTYVNKWVRLYFNKTLFIKQNAEQIRPVN